MRAEVKPWFAYGFGIALIALALWPLVTKRGSFPFSDYPMFAETRGRQARLYRAVAVAAQKPDLVLSPEYFGTDEVLQAKATLDRAARSDATALALCKEIASRVAQRSDLHASRVELRAVTYDAIDYFANPDAPPLKQEVRTVCPVVDDKAT